MRSDSKRRATQQSKKPAAEIEHPNPFTLLAARRPTEAEIRAEAFAGIERGEPGDNVVLWPLGAACYYARRYGWKTFPARMEAGKKYSWLSAEHAPGHERWGATADFNQLRKNFSNPKWRKKCGVGLPTGAGNGIVIVEADTIKGHSVDGLASLERMQAEQSRDHNHTYRLSGR